jgi:hypothetical protein
VIPDDLDRMEPGPVLAVLLSTIDVACLSGYDQVVVLRAQQRMASHYQAQVYQVMASISDLIEGEDDNLELAWEAASSEIETALHLTRRAADAELSLALDLKRRLPKVWVALASGDIDLRRARVIVRGTAHLDVEAARGVVDRILGRASRLTTGQLNAHGHFDPAVRGSW